MAIGECKSRVEYDKDGNIVDIINEASERLFKIKKNEDGSILVEEYDQAGNKLGESLWEKT